MKEFDACKITTKANRVTMKCFRCLFHHVFLLGFVWLAVGCVVHEADEYFAPTGLDGVRNRNGGFPPSKPDSAFKILPGLKRFEVMSFVLSDGRILVRIFADADDGETSGFREDRALVISADYLHEVRLTWDNVKPSRSFSAPVDNSYYSDLYLPESMKSVQRFRVELPAHESSPAPIRVDFERQKRSHLITTRLQ